MFHFPNYFERRCCSKRVSLNYVKIVKEELEKLLNFGLVKLTKPDAYHALW